MSELSDGMVLETLRLIDKMFYNGEKVNFYTVATKAKVSRPFLYKHEEIVNKISYYRNFNSLSVEEKFQKLNNENKELLEKLNQYDDYFLDFYIKHNS